MQKKWSSYKLWYQYIVNSMLRSVMKIVSLERYCHNTNICCCLVFLQLLNIFAANLLWCWDGIWTRKTICAVETFKLREVSTIQKKEKLNVGTKSSCQTFLISFLTADLVFVIEFATFGHRGIKFTSVSDLIMKKLNKLKCANKM